MVEVKSKEHLERLDRQCRELEAWQWWGWYAKAQAEEICRQETRFTPWRFERCVSTKTRAIESTGHMAVAAAQVLMHNYAGVPDPGSPNNPRDTAPSKKK